MSKPIAVDYRVRLNGRYLMGVICVTTEHSVQDLTNVTLTMLGSVAISEEEKLISITTDEEPGT